MKNFNVDFVDVSGMGVIHHWPIELAHKTESICDIQKEKDGKDNFSACPGISDYKNQGWIMRAWTDIHIFADEKTTMVYYGDADPKNPRAVIEDTMYKKHCPIVPCGTLDKNISKHLPIYSEMMYPEPMHFKSPWIVKCDKEISLALLPAYYHGDFAKKMHIYPGIIDVSSGFGTMNMIACPIRKGKFTVRAGTPLMHIIPLQKGEFKSTSRMGSDVEKSRDGFAPTSAKQWYRRLFMKFSKYKHENLNV